MKNKGIVIFLLIVAVILVVMIVADYRSGRPGRSKGNPFALDINAYKTVDPSLVNYREAKNLRIGLEAPTAIKIFNDTIYVTGDRKLQIISLSGNLLNEFSFPFSPAAFEVTQEHFFLATKNRIYTTGKDGAITSEWLLPDADSHITSLAASEENLFVADAGKRNILRYSHEGELMGRFDGKADEGALHGFIIPSAMFDLCVNSDNELWVVNPGLHTLENYTFEGKLRGYWKRSGINHEGFSGCCNPGHIAFLSDGRFVTSEKGLVRIKTYRPSGDFDGVVAAPSKFNDDGRAPDVAADSRDNIYALDFDRKLIRIFNPVEDYESGKHEAVN